MRIDWAIPCRVLEVTNGLATILGGGIDTYWVKEFPVDIQVLLAVRFMASEEDLVTGRSQTLMLRLLSPEMELLSELSTTVTGSDSPGRRPGWELGVIRPVVQRFRIEEPGVYTIGLAIEGKTTTVPIAVEQGPRPTP